MNISGIVVRTAPEYMAGVIRSMEAEGLCEVHFQDDHGTIIVTIEGNGTGEEVKKMLQIMNIPHVLCADLAYSYNEAGTGQHPGGPGHIRSAVPDSLAALPADA